MPDKLKLATFSVRATAAQSARWKQAAEQAGHATVGSWVSEAITRYLAMLDRQGMPIPLVWQRGRFKVALSNGETVDLKGHVSPPFAAYAGGKDGYKRKAWLCTLVYLPTGRPLATLRTYQQCKLLASELSRMWIKWDGIGEAPAEDITPVLERYRPEAV